MAVAVNRPVSMTYIGITPNGDIIETSKSDVRGQITVSSADVRNTVDGLTKVTSLGPVSYTHRTPGRVPRKKEKRTNRQTRVLAEHLRLQEKPATVI